MQRVLVVDDNEDAAEVLAIVLRELGHDVRTACDGPTAVTLAKDFNPTCAWLDISMPGMDGLEVARAIKQDLGDRCLLIALSGYGEARDRQATHEAGFDLHLLKPVELARIREVMGQVAATGNA